MVLIIEPPLRNDEQF